MAESLVLRSIVVSDTALAFLDSFRLAEGTKAEVSRHVDAARLRDRALQPASGALRRYVDCGTE